MFADLNLTTTADCPISDGRKMKLAAPRSYVLCPMRPLKKKSQIILGVSGGVWAGACLVLNASVQY